MNNTAALQKENELLRKQLAAHEEKLKEEHVKIATRDAQIAVLNEQLKQLLKKRFGSSSEKVSQDQLGLFNEAEETLSAELPEDTETTTVKSHTRTRKPRVSIPDNFPREEFVHDISDSEKVCPHDGTALNVIGSEDHEQLDIVPATIKVIRHKRLKYACPCCESHIITASKPKQPIEKSIASPGLLAYVAIQKYADAMPLYRQSDM